jgi:phage-related protein
MKKLQWLGDSLEVVRSWPAVAKKRAGDGLHYVQRGFDPTNWKALKGFREAVREIRIRIDKRHYRVVYITSFEETVYVLHAFVKKSNTTPKQEIETIKSRLKDLRQLRARG